MLVTNDTLIANSAMNGYSLSHNMYVITKDKIKITKNTKGVDKYHFNLLSRKYLINSATEAIRAIGINNIPQIKGSPHNAIPAISAIGPGDKEKSTKTTITTTTNEMIIERKNEKIWRFIVIRFLSMK